MQEKHLYEYAVIRVFPKVEREEFINVGIILFSKKANYIKMRYYLDVDKLKMFSNELDMDLIKTTLDTFQKIVDGDQTGGTIAQLVGPERFRWLTNERSSCIQTSRPHVGFSDDLEKTLNRLFAELVL